MCLSIPSKIKSIDEEMNMCVVDTMGVERSASLDLIDQEVKVGDYVLLHIGFAMNKIDEEDALESLKIYREIIDKMEEEEREREDNSLSSLAPHADCDVDAKQTPQDGKIGKIIAESENCPNR